MQGVEEEVGMDLHLQSFQLRLYQLSSELRLLQLALPETVVVVQRVAHHYQQPINRHLPVQVEEDISKHPEPTYLRPIADISHENRVMDRGHRAYQQQPEDCVKEKPPHPVLSFDTKTARQPKNQGRGQGPQVADRHLPK